EAAITDLRTILRGVKQPPDEVTIVEIDDSLVKQAGSFPLPRRELGRLVQTIVRLKPWLMRWGPARASLRPRRCSRNRVKPSMSSTATTRSQVCPRPRNFSFH